MNSAVIIGYLWLVFVVVWLLSALTAKRTARYSFGGWGFRLLLTFVIILALTQSSVQSSVPYLFRPLPNVYLDGLGVVFVVLGVAFAFWARFYLGRNWGMPMTLKKDAELVTSGPYAYVRHPIYSGVILAMLGSGLGAGSFWFAILVVSGGYFIYAATQEEKIMAGEFPQQYPAYKARTKMLIPFVF